MGEPILCKYAQLVENISIKRLNKDTLINSVIRKTLQ